MCFVAANREKMIRVVHYINQFFGGIGGEDKAHLPPRIQGGAVGPAKAVQMALQGSGEVVATVICGDNYYAENIDAASAEIIQMIAPFRPQVLIAGPAFNAGRYGMACGAVCKAVQERLAIPAVTGMYEENPGLELYRSDVYILPTADSVRGMGDAIPRMVALARKLAGAARIGTPSEEGYFARGLLVNESAEKTGAERVMDMLVAKLRGESFQSEVPRPAYDRVDPAPPIADLSSARVALVTDGGLVPKGNPDKIEIRTATRFGRYDIRGIDALAPAGYEVSHEGYDSIFVRQDPNRLVPVDVLRDLEREELIGSLHDRFYSTTGVANIVEVMKGIGSRIAGELKAEGVAGVILTST
jgi:glycine reductase complex component B subunit gamma